MITNDREYRQGSVKKTPTGIQGYPVVFNKESEWLTDPKTGIKFKEKILPTAFDKTDFSDAVLVKNHEGPAVASERTKTLKVQPDEIGVAIDADLTKTQYARETLEEADAGFLPWSSFSFPRLQEGKDYDYDPKTHLRTIKHIPKVYDFSLLSVQPAYQAAALWTRSLYDVEAEKDLAVEAATSVTGEPEKRSLLQKQIEIKLKIMEIKNGKTH